MNKSASIELLTRPANWFWYRSYRSVIAIATLIDQMRQISWVELSAANNFHFSSRASVLPLQLNVPYACADIWIVVLWVSSVMAIGRLLNIARVSWAKWKIKYNNQNNKLRLGPSPKKLHCKTCCTDRENHIKDWSNIKANWMILINLKERDR